MCSTETREQSHCCNRRSWSNPLFPRRFNQTFSVVFTATYHRWLNIRNDFWWEDFPASVATACNSMNLTELHYPNTRLICPLVVNHQPRLPRWQLQVQFDTSFRLRTIQRGLVRREKISICESNNHLVWLIQYNLHKAHSISHLPSPHFSDWGFLCFTIKATHDHSNESTGTPSFGDDDASELGAYLLKIKTCVGWTGNLHPVLLQRHTAPESSMWSLGNKEQERGEQTNRIRAQEEGWWWCSCRERERGTKGGEEEYTSGVEPAVRTVDMATAISVGLNGSSGWADCTRGTEIPAPANTPHQDTSCRRIH